MRREPVESGTIVSVGYDPALNTLEIEFRSGGVYQYFQVPPSRYRELRATDSPGSYFARRIRNDFPWRRVDE